MGIGSPRTVTGILCVAGCEPSLMPNWAGGEMQQNLVRNLGKCEGIADDFFYACKKNLKL